MPILSRTCRVRTAATLTCLVVGLAAVDTSTAWAAEPLVSLPGSVVPAVAHATPVGTLPAARTLSIALEMRLRDPAGLAAFDTAVSTPGTSDYGHYLTPAQFADRYGPTQASVDAVRRFLDGAGVTVTAVSGNRQVVDVTGSVGALSSIFHTGISLFREGTRTFYANESPVRIPAPLASSVEGVIGLDDLTVAIPASPAPQAGPVGGLSPTQIGTAYRFNQIGATGAGQTVALWEFDGYKSANLTTYATQYGISGPAVTTVSVDRANYDAAPGTGQFEVEEDSEIVSAIAPAATQLVYEAPNTGPGSLDMANKIVSDGRASVISVSWGECEQQPSASYLTAINNAFSQAVAQGVSIYSASGDRGSRDCPDTPGVQAVDFPGSSLYDTSVGGTRITLGTGSAYGSESAWTDGGGGLSTVFSRPSWQATTLSTMRTVPDVASVADPASGYSAYINGAWTQAGGTSAGAPAWSAFTALYNQRATAAGKPTLGFASPAINQIGTGAKYASALHDVTAGANDDYSAGPGFDAVTGWGSPIGDGLVTALLGGGSSANTVTVTNPGTQTGVVGTAVSLAVKATDSGGATLTYAATGLPAGLSINATTGVISGKPTTVGTVTTTVTATDTTKASGSTSFTWNVTAAGSTVTMTNPGVQSTMVGTAVSLAVKATDSGNAALTYTATGLPAGLSINASTGVITGTPTAVGASQVSVTATDPAKASASVSFTWNVTSPANSVTMVNPGGQTTKVGTAVSLAVKATDSSSSATLTYTATGLPTGLSINATTGVITGTPTAAGSYSVTVTATDNTKSWASSTFPWTVTAPSCTSPGQKLANPGFESGAVNWTAAKGLIGQFASVQEPAHGGTWAAKLDGTGKARTDTVSQSVTIPQGCTATFSFWLHADTKETSKTAKNDVLTVKADSTVLATFTNLNAATGYVQHTYSLSAFAGDSVTLTFSGSENGSLATTFEVDDTAATVS